MVVCYRTKMSQEAKIDQQKTPRPQLNSQEDNETKRIDRNETEKKRRNRFNGLIDELAACIADRCKTKRSTEKSSILRLTIEYFREQETLAAQKATKERFGNIKPAFVTYDEFSFVFLESMCAFVLAVDKLGNFVYISDNVLAGLGHLPGEILQRNLLDFIHEREHFIFQGLLSAMRTQLSSSGCRGRNLSLPFEPFYCHFQRGPHGQEHGFETVYCCGTILGNLTKEKDPNVEVSDCLLVLVKPSKRVAFNTTLIRSDGPHTKFSATFSMKGQYDYLDKRVASVLGFFPSELIGSSLYDFCHHEDLADLVEYHRILLVTGTITTCYYRHLTKGQSWIWLQSRYHLSYSDWTSEPQAVTCLSWAVPYEEVCAKQSEILTCDREKFAQIRAAQKITDGNLNSSNNSLNSSITASPRFRSKVAVGNSNSERTVSHSPVSSLERTPGSEDSRNESCTSLTSYSSDLMESEVTKFEEFLQRLQLPMDLTSAQHDLHKFLTRVYMQIVSAINKQTEELEAIQKQIKLQGELRDLIERLEEAKSTNDIEREYTIKKDILEKFEEMRHVSVGSHAEIPGAQSLEICSKPLQEFPVENLSQQQHTAVFSEGERGISSQRDRELQQDFSPTQAEQQPIAQRQQDIFFYNQEQWLQTQAQQAQLQQQIFLTRQLLNPQYLPQDRLMVLQQQPQQQHPTAQGFQQPQYHEVNQQILLQEPASQNLAFQSSNASNAPTISGSETSQEWENMGNYFPPSFREEDEVFYDRASFY